MLAEQKMDLSENMKLLAGETGWVLAANQIMKFINSDEHTMHHSIEAGVREAVAIRAY